MVNISKKSSPIELASCARYGEINWKGLTIKDLKEKDSFGETLLHHLIRLATSHKNEEVTHGKTSYNFSKESKFEDIPKNLLCHEILSQKTNKGESIYFYLAKAGELGLVPQNLITREVLLEERLDGETLIFEILQKKQTETISPKLMKEGILLEEYKPLGTSYLHICAMIGEIKKLPKEAWVDKLSLKDAGNNNLLHWAADGIFEGYPVNQETKELMIAQNDQGETPLHKSRDLYKMPKEFLTPKNLLIKDKQRRTPLYWASYRNPEKFLEFWKNRRDLKQEDLIQKNSREKTVIHNILTKYEAKGTKSLQKLKNFLGSLSPKTLMEIRNLKIESKNSHLILKELLRKKIATSMGSSEKTIDLA